MKFRFIQNAPLFNKLLSRPQIRGGGKLQDFRSSDSDSVQSDSIFEGQGKLAKKVVNQANGVAKNITVQDNGVTRRVVSQAKKVQEETLNDASEGSTELIGDLNDIANGMVNGANQVTRRRT